MQICQGHLNRLWDFAKGGPRENAQKSRPTIGVQKHPAQIAASPNWYALESAIFWDAAPKVPSYVKFAKDT